MVETFEFEDPPSSPGSSGGGGGSDSMSLDGVVAPDGGAEAFDGQPGVSEAEGPNWEGAGGGGTAGNRKVDDEAGQVGRDPGTYRNGAGGAGAGTGTGVEENRKVDDDVGSDPGTNPEGLAMSFDGAGAGAEAFGGQPGVVGTEEMTRDGSEISFDRAGAGTEENRKVVDEAGPDPSIGAGLGGGLQVKTDAGAFEDAVQEDDGSAVMEAESNQDNDPDGDIIMTDRETPRLTDPASPIDLVKLCDLLEKTKEAGNSIQGKDILLLVGSTGAGKTTTLLHLAGTAFKEVEVGGFDHYEPLGLTDSKLASFAVSGGGASATRCIQATEVLLGDETVVLCDTPGFGDTDGVETDISNCMGVIGALKRAKSVKIVLVLNAEGLSDRFRSLSDTLDTVRRMLPPGSVSAYYSSFNYVFTRCPEKEAKRMRSKLASFRETITSNTSETNTDVLSLLDDMIEKTTPRALIVEPTKFEEAGSLLEQLFGDGKERIDDPQSSFCAFQSRSSSESLLLSLESTVSGVESALSVEAFDAAQANLEVLARLHGVLPEMTTTYLQRASSVVHKFISLCGEDIRAILQRTRLLDFSQRDILEHEASLFRMRLHTLVAADSALSADVDIPEPERAGAVLSAVIKILVRDIKRCTAKDEDCVVDYIDQIIRVEPTLKYSLLRLSHAVAAFRGFPGGDDLETEYNKGCDRLLQRITQAVNVDFDYSQVEAIPSFACSITERILFAERVEAIVSKELHLENDSCIVDAICKAKRCLREKLEKSQHCICNTTDEMLQHTSGDVTWSLSSLPTFAFQTLGVELELLVAFAQCRGLCTMLGTCLSASDLLKIVTSFDEATSSFLLHTVSFLEQEFEELKNISEASDLESMRKHADMIMTKLREGILICKRCLQHSIFSPESIHAASERLVKTQGFLELFLSNLDEQAASLAIELRKATASASDYAQRLRSGRADRALLLSELSQPENFPSWEACLNKNKPGFGAKFVRSFRSWFGVDNGGTKDLENTLDHLVNTIRLHMNTASTRLMRLSLDEMHPNGVAKALLQESAEAVHLLFSYLTIQYDSSLAKRIATCKDTLRFERSITNAVNLLKKGFGVLCGSPQTLLQGRKFSAVAELLSLWKGSESNGMWEAFRSFAYMVEAGTQNNARQRHLKELSNNILECQSYNGLQRDAIAAATQLRLEIEKMSLHFTAVGANVHERSHFYAEKGRLLEAALSLSLLSPLLLEMGQDELSEISIEATAHFEKEIGRVGHSLMKALSNFPNDKLQFVLLYDLVRNLESIETVLKDVSSSLSHIAADLKGDGFRFFSRSLEDITQAPTTQVDSFVRTLLLLKSASREILCWSREINQCVDLLLAKAAASSQSTFLLDVSLHLRNLDGDDGAIAQQILSDHSCFEGILNAVLDEATSGQGIAYVLKGLEDQGLSACESGVLKRMYESFEGLYKQLVADGLGALRNSANETDSSFLQGLVAAAHEVSLDFTLDYADQVCSLTAHIFAYWSLSSSNSLAMTGDSSEGASKYLMKPHAAQVVAVWIMLNCAHTEHQLLENQLMEVKTGEGKSIVLGVTATILALFGFNIDCICYSSYLSGRDSKAFEGMFVAFNVVSRIWYGTITGLLYRVLDLYYELAESTIADSMEQQERSRSRPPQVMLIDEVDVFFGEDVFGKASAPATKLTNNKVIELFQHVWRNSDSLNEGMLSHSSEVQQVLDEFPGDIHNLIRNQLRKMAQDAQKVKIGTAREYFISNGKIAYKRFDGLTTSNSHGYETYFAYFKEWENNNVSWPTLERKVGLKSSIGKLSYAELPFGYEVILGVTGTLNGIGRDERAVIETMYGVNKSAYVPSVYGKNKLRFEEENSSDITVSDRKEDHFLDLKHEIIRRRRSKDGDVEDARSVMVFFHNQKMLLDFYNSSIMQGMKSQVRTITETAPESEKEGMFLKATEGGAITLMIREFGRGTDFKCFDRKMLKEGGVHVIQAFFSTDPSEEIQIKGRCARQGAEGSFSMVLNAEDLQRRLELTTEAVQMAKSQGTLFSLLSTKREALVHSKVEKMKTNVADLESKHYRTLVCKAAMEEENSRSQRGEILGFFYELNGLGDCTAFADNDLKAAMILERQQVLQEHCTADKETRRKAREVLLLEASQADMLRLEVRERLKNDGTVSDRELLGVGPGAAVDEVRKAYRQLSLLFHPDKCSDEDASDVFRRLTEAKDSLT